MTAKCRTTLKNTTCAPTAQEPQTVSCTPFDTCLSFGRTLHFDGNCLSARGTPNTLDGWYGEVQVVNGCIVAARPVELPTYTPAPCAPAAGPCGGDTGGGSNTGCPPISPNVKNLSYCDNGALMSELVFGTLDGISKTGTGTRNDPLNLSASGGSGGGTTYITAGSPEAITISGNGSLIDSYIIGMTNSALAAGVHGDITTDPWGRIIAYSPPDGGAIQTLMDGVGTTATSAGGIGRIDIKNTGVTAAPYVFGGYTASINAQGQTTSITRNITIAPGVYRLGAFDATLTETGSISKIVATTPTTAGVATTFTAQFTPDTGSNPGGTREIQITTPVDGLLYVEYHGYMGVFTGSSTIPGVTLTANGLYILIDDVKLPNPMLTLSLLDRPSSAVAKMARIGIRATTKSVIPAGTHIITIYGDVDLPLNAGFCKIDIVGRGE